MNLQKNYKSGVRKERRWNNQSYFCETSERFLLFWVGLWIWIYTQTALQNCNSAIKYHWHSALVWGVDRKRAKAAVRKDKKGTEESRQSGQP